MNDSIRVATWGDRLDVVYIGNVASGRIGFQMPEIFRDDYVFLFSTKLDVEKDSLYYGSVKIDLVMHDQLSYFNKDLREYGAFHFLENETLVINDFLEVTCEKIKNGIQIIANLKSQNILLEDYRTLADVKDFRILLFRGNYVDFYDNCPVWEIGPEFQAIIDYHKAEQHFEELDHALSTVERMAFFNRKNSNLASASEIVEIALNKKIEDARIKKELAFERVLDLRNRLLYTHKTTLT